MLIEEKVKRRPVVDPLLLTLKSRRVVIALCALGMGLLVLAIPELGVVQEELLTLLITLALALIGGYSLEDAAREAHRVELDQPEVQEQLKTLFGAVIDEWLLNQGKMETPERLERDN